MSYAEADDGFETPEEIFKHYGEHDAEICILRDAFNQLKSENERLREALKKCSRSINQYYLKMQQCCHEQSIHEDDHDLWFARDSADLLLKELGEK